MGNFNANVSGAAIEQSMENAQRMITKKNDFDAKNYLDTKLGNELERNIVIRILPVSNEDGNFRIAVKTHNLKVNHHIASSGFKSFLCLNDPQVPDYDPSVKCPLCEKSNYYFDEARKCRETEPEKSKALFVKACSLKSKTTYIVRVIERGKENEGVKFWRFNENTQGKGIYDSLIALYKQRKDDMAEAGVENYNIFDLDNGRDIVLNLKKTVRADGKEGVAIQITDKSINKPLTTDVNQGNAWINDVKRWYNAYTVKSAEYLSIVAEDKIPFYDKNNGVLLAKTEQDFKDFEAKKAENNAAAEAASEILKEKQYQQPNLPENNDDDDTNLPF